MENIGFLWKTIGEYKKYGGYESQRGKRKYEKI
jgi:hypothetical protein